MTVLVTGAAGSIGSEVCRRLVARGEHVVMVDLAETPLFWLEGELRSSGLVTAVIGNVREREAMARVIADHEPTELIHAAAIKHVGMADANVCEAVLTNVLGTMVVGEQAALCGARFILVSTDKAVEPSTAMGATKRLAEMVTAGIRGSRIVRLVNIRGSAGSLVPVWLKQIEAGGPLKLTDARMRRFFMDIGPAVDLIVGEMDGPGVLRSLVRVPIGTTSELIIDIAHSMIAESGRTIEIIEAGKKPGEKLAEQIYTALEGSRLQVGGCFEAALPSFDAGKGIRRLITLAQDGAERATAELLYDIARGN